MSEASRSEEVVAAALRQLARGGSGWLTHRGLASETGLSVGTLSQRFPTIDRVIEASLAALRAHQTKRLRALTAGFAEEPTPTGFVRSLTSYSARRLREDRDMLLSTHALIQVAARSEGLQPQLRALLAEEKAVVTEGLLALGVEDADGVAGRLLGLVRGRLLEELAAPREKFGSRLRQDLQRLLGVSNRR